MKTPSASWALQRTRKIVLAGLLLLSAMPSHAAAGKIQIARDINPGAADAMDFKRVNAFDGIAYFGADDGTNGPQLWRTDGTKKGTILLKKIPGTPSDFDPEILGSTNGQVYYLQANKLVRTSGNAGSTAVVYDFTKVPGFSSLCEVRLCGNRIFFIVLANSGSELWVWTGPNAAQKLATFGDNYPHPIGALAAIDNDVLFTADFGALGQSSELWRSKGTPATTEVIKTFGGQVSNGFGRYGDKYYSVLTATPGNDGSGSNPDIYQIWVSDGTEEGTTMVVDLGSSPDDSGPVNFFAVGNQVFFAYTTTGDGRELWVTSGGTSASLVKNIHPSGNSNPVPLAAFNGRLLFIANDGTHGFELWASDGSSGGTGLLYESIDGATNGNFSGSDASVTADAWYFAALVSGSSKIFKLDLGGQITRVDTGTNAVTVGSDLCKAGSRLFFTGGSTATGSELGVLDLGEAGSPNHKPVAVADKAATTQTHFSVTANDTDEDLGDLLTVQSVKPGRFGTATLESDGTVTYTPGTDFKGTDTFEYTVVDLRGGTAKGNVTVQGLPKIFAKSSFTGLVKDGSNKTSGLLLVSFAANGAVTGQLDLKGTSTRFKGTMSPDGELTVNLTMGGVTLTLDITLDGDAGEIAGTVSDGVTIHTFTGLSRPLYSAKSPTSLVGKYVVAASPDFISFDTPVPRPGGILHAALTITKAGLVRMTGVGPDGSKFSAGGAILPGNVWPFYGAVPYANAGWFGGQMTLTHTSSFDFTGSMIWEKPAQVSPDGLFPNGFRSTLPLCGLAWPGPVGRALPAPLPSSGPISVNFAGVNQIWTCTAPNRLKVTDPSPDPLDLKITLDPKSGIISGTYKAGDGKRYPFSAVLLPDDTFIGSMLGVKVEPTGTKVLSF